MIPTNPANPKDAVSHVYKTDADYSWGRLRDGGVVSTHPDAEAVADELMAHRHAALSDMVAKYSPDEPRDDHGRWTTGGSSGDSPGLHMGAMFVSPNAANLSFTTATHEMHGERQQHMKAAAHDVNSSMGLSSHEEDAIGAWKDGAENTVVSHIGPTTFDRIEVAGAMAGSLANQKSVLVFQTGAGDNSHFIASFDAKGSLGDIHDDLLSKGLEFHTLEPRPGGARVLIYGTDADTRKLANDVGKTYGSRTSIEYGLGKFVGSSRDTGSDSEIRSDAQAVYDNTIRSFAARQPGGQDVAASWQRLRDRWGQITKSLTDLFIAAFEEFSPS